MTHHHQSEPHPSPSRIEDPVHQQRHHQQHIQHHRLHRIEPHEPAEARVSDDAQVEGEEGHEGGVWDGSVEGEDREDGLQDQP